MNNSFGNFDIQSAIKSLVTSVREMGGFNPEQVGKAAFADDSRLRAAILVALLGTPKTGHDIMLTLGADHGVKNIDAARVYPLLEELLDTGLVSAKFEKDRRVFKLTTEGNAQAKQSESAQDEASGASGASGGSSGSVNWPKWVDLTGTLPRSLAKLASVSFEVSNSATKEQQAEAAEVLDQARKQLHAILAKD
jgi:DNA-binding PadR family transcriptional regulator